MKNTKVFRLLPALVLLVLALSWVRPLVVAQQAQDPVAPIAQQEQQQHPDAMNQPSEVKTFSGKIMKSGDQLVLKDSASKSTFKLDDQDKAKSFEGKNVKVTGTLDPATRTVRIASIELEAGY